MIKVEVVEGKSEVREVRSKDGQIVALKQEVYAHMPDQAYPVRCFVRVERPHAPGFYVMTPHLRVNKYGELEIDSFTAPKLSSVTKTQPKVA
jgi:hypothetical protein